MKKVLVVLAPIVFILALLALSVVLEKYPVKDDSTTEVQLRAVVVD